MPMKSCPYCAEDIQDAAIVCKHCQRDLPQSIPPPIPAPAKQPTVIQRMGRLFVYALMGAGAVTAVIAIANNDSSTEKPSRTLSVGVRASTSQLELINQGSEPGILVTIYLNGTPPFTYGTDVAMPPNGQAVQVPLMQFTKKDGERFNPLTHAVTEVWVGGNGYDFRSFSMER